LMEFRTAGHNGKDILVIKIILVLVFLQLFTNLLVLVLASFAII